MKFSTENLFSKKEKTALIIFGIVVCVAASLAYASIPSGALEVHFLDVGQGDSIFIQTPMHYQVLVDGGPEGRAILRELENVMPFYDRSIDIVAVTHLDADHIGGLIYVLENFKVEAVLVSQTEPDSPLGEKFFKMISENNIKLVKVEAGDSIVFDNDIKMNFLWPPEQAGLYSSNDLSLVFKLIYKDDSFLLTGDIERRPELFLAQNTDITAEVLKVGHHGSNTSSNEYFLKKVDPKLAVIQVGENNYGHPHRYVLKRFKDKGIEILRNDKNGVISIYSYGDSI